MPEINENRINQQPNGVTKPTEEHGQRVDNENKNTPETPEEEETRRFKEIKDDMFRRRTKLMKRLAE